MYMYKIFWAELLKKRVLFKIPLVYPISNNKTDLVARIIMFVYTYTSPQVCFKSN